MPGSLQPSRPSLRRPITAVVVAIGGLAAAVVAGFGTQPQPLDADQSEDISDHGRPSWKHGQPSWKHGQPSWEYGEPSRDDSQVMPEVASVPHAGSPAPAPRWGDDLAQLGPWAVDGEVPNLELLPASPRKVRNRVEGLDTDLLDRYLEESEENLGELASVDLRLRQLMADRGLFSQLEALECRGELCAADFRFESAHDLRRMVGLRLGDKSEFLVTQRRHSEGAVTLRIYRARVGQSLAVLATLRRSVKP